MAIVKTSVQDFDAELLSFVTNGEGSKPQAYLDSLYHVPTIGYGFAIGIRNQSTGVITLRSDLQTAFNGIYTFTQTELDFLNNLIADINAGNITQATSNLEIANNSGGELDTLSVNTTQSRTLF